MNKLKKTFLLLTLFLFGCTTYWKNPSGRNWDADLYMCNSQSTFNQCYVTPGRVDTNCVSHGPGQTSCSSVTIPETTRCQNEINVVTRDNCLRGHGWIETDKDGKPI